MLEKILKTIKPIIATTILSTYLVGCDGDSPVNIEPENYAPNTYSEIHILNSGQLIRASVIGSDIDDGLKNYFEYKFDEESWQIAEWNMNGYNTGYVTRQNMAQGYHIFKARTIDNSGQIDETPAESIFNID
jgi:hypothetical protein|tara:strand:+ start:1474 stop:1869 length:396 start_codon:yes stop_codon:yes gene_type:complete